MAKNPLFVAIGVHDASGMQTLDGVHEGIDLLTRWAGDEGYDVIAIDDRAGAVTVAGIKKRLTHSRLLSRPRIVVYFCGHGLHAPQDQYWVLSAGPTQPNERISVVGFRDTLATYGPGQIAMISDACRSPQAVIGQGQSVVDVYPGNPGPVQKDNFFSSQDGAASFAVPAQNGKPGYCVFTSVLVNALTTPIPDALDQLYQQLGRQIVSSQSLATYLENYVPTAAISVNKFQAPQCDPGFRPTTNDYVEFLDGGAAGIAPPPTGPGLSAQPPDLPPDFDFSYATIRAAPEFEALQRRRVDLSRSEWRGPFVEAAERIITQAGPGYPQAEWILVASNDPCGIIGKTGAEQSVKSTGPIGKITKSEIFRPKPQSGFAHTGRSSVLIVRSADLYAPLPIFDHLWCALGFSSRSQAAENSIGGVEVLVWGPEYPSQTRDSELSAVEALKGLSFGTLTSDETRLLTTSMRRAKHADPLLGIVSAYLYNAIGDVENIRRMCYYYLQHGQDAPFDVALLAGVPLNGKPGAGFYVDVPAVPELPRNQRSPGDPAYVWESTPPFSIALAGVTPVLRAGWQHVRASQHTVHRRCWELTDQLTESPISTFAGADVGDELFRIFQGL